jgi:hypothetical protein
LFGSLGGDVTAGCEDVAPGALLVLLAAMPGVAGCEALVDFARRLSLVATKATPPASARIAISPAAHRPSLRDPGLPACRKLFLWLDFLFLDMKIF